MPGFFTLPRIAWGTGAVEQLSGLGAQRVFLLTEPETASTDPVRRIAEEFAKGGASVTSHTASGPLVRTTTVEALAALGRSAGPDWICAVGGGDLIDAAKAMRLRLELPGIPLEEVTPLTEFPPVPRSRLVAIPATSGRGREVSGTIALEREDGSPLEIFLRETAPDWAMVDPQLARWVPTGRGIEAGLPVLGQAIESLVSAWSNPFSDALAFDALLQSATHLPRLGRPMDDEIARERLHYAATQAGMAAANAQVGIAHALALALREPTGLSYDRLYGIVLPFAVEFSFRSARDRYEAISGVLASAAGEGGRIDLPLRLRTLLEMLKIPANLVAAGVDRTALWARRKEIVARLLRSPATLANPRVPSEGEAERLIELLLGGGPAGR
ncbi:MAG: iron-containing alcohol dehydrogenase [Thermoplasmata archaeon]